MWINLLYSSSSLSNLNNLPMSKGCLVSISLTSPLGKNVWSSPVLMGWLIILSLAPSSWNGAEFRLTSSPPPGFPLNSAFSFIGTLFGWAELDTLGWTCNVVIVWAKALMLGFNGSNGTVPSWNIEVGGFTGTLMKCDCFGWVVAFCPWESAMLPECSSGLCVFCCLLSPPCENQQLYIET